MSKLSLQLWGETSPTDWQLIGWRSDSKALLLLDPAGERRVLPLALPSLAGVVIGGLSPDWNPQSIRPTRLLPPPFRDTELEARALIDFAATHDFRSYDTRHGLTAAFCSFAIGRGSDGATVPDIWELEYGEALWPKPEDDEPLQALLLEWQAAHRRERDTRLAKIQKLPPPERKALRTQLHEVYDAPLRQTTSGTWHGGCLNLTLDAIKQGGELCDAVLHRRWAKECGLELEQVREQRKAFTNLTRLVRLPSSIPNTDALQQCLASVRYKIGFGNPSDSFWLTDCKPRPPQTRQEVGEFDKLCPRRKPTASTAFAQTAPPAAAEVANWPDLLSRKQLLQMLGCAKSNYVAKLAELGVHPIKPDSKRKQYRKADVLAALHRNGPAGTTRDNGPSETSTG